MSKLSEYFGVVGIASIGAWMATLCILAACFRSRRRPRWYLAAFVLSLVGIGLAKLNSHAISTIEIDRSQQMAELEAAEQLPKEPAPEPVAPETPTLRFAEETREEARDLAGKKANTAAPSEKGSSNATHPASSIQHPVSSVYAYRERGKQKREEGKKRELEEVKDLIAVKKDRAVRTMPEADVIRADRFDRLNLFFARLTPWLAIAMVVYDYLTRFNKTQGYLPPLPIACRVIDRLFPKTHAVRVEGSADDLRRYLADVVRKGETFLLLAPRDPWTEPALPRLPLRRWRLWPLPKVAYASGDDVDHPTFILDGLWFGRYCFVITDAAAARGLLDDLLGYLEARRAPRAAVRRTVHVVWAFDELLPDGLLERLAFLCRETNFKLVVASDQPAPAVAPPFEEHVRLGTSTP